jgi:hypothetical protein
VSNVLQRSYVVQQGPAHTVRHQHWAQHPSWHLLHALLWVLHCSHVAAVLEFGHGKAPGQPEAADIIEVRAPAHTQHSQSSNKLLTQSHVLLPLVWMMTCWQQVPAAPQVASLLDHQLHLLQGTPQSPAA